MLTPLKAVKSYFLQHDDAYDYAKSLATTGNVETIKDYYSSQLETAHMTPQARAFTYACLDTIPWSEIGQWLKNPNESPLPKHVPVKRM